MLEPTENAIPGVGSTNFRHLVESLSADDFATRHAAADRLFGQGRAALDAILGGMAHPNPKVRSHCVGLLDHLADARCVEPLRVALRDPVADVCRHAVHSISCQRCKPAPLKMDVTGHLIERALTDPSVRVRQVAAHALGHQAPDPRAVAALRTILRGHSNAKLLSRARYSLDQHERGLAAAGPG